MNARKAFQDLWTRAGELPEVQERYIKTRLRLIARETIQDETRPGRFLVSGGSLRQKYRIEDQAEAEAFAARFGAEVTDGGVGL